jgi:hypothetical protein
MDRASSGSKHEEEEYEMHGSTEYEIGRQHREEIGHEVAVTRLEGKLRANRERGSRPARELKGELSRYAGLLGERAWPTPTTAARTSPG